jgi:acylphosphatase
LKVTGWVRNLPDGRVELVAEGSAMDLERLMTELAKGPPASRVDKVEQTEEAYTGEFKHFKIVDSPSRSDN